MKPAFRILYYFALGLLAFALHHALDLLFTLALTAIAVGLWWERPSLGLIVPGVIVLAVATWGRIVMNRDDS